MAAVRHVRFHGRGGEGVKLASRIVSRALFCAGHTVQDSPVYGAERRGAPVVAFVRFGEGPIHERGYVANPELVVVMDESLLGHPDAAIMDGLDASSLVLVNSTHSSDVLKRQHQIAGRVLTQDISTLALEILGHHLLSAPIAGFTAKTTALVSWDVLAGAVEQELADAGLASGLIERNLAATRRAYDAAPAIGFPAQRPSAAQRPSTPFQVPRLPARLAAPSILAESTSALRTTEGWRVYRPVIDLTGCTRCFLCFALCPEGAIHLDREHYPFIDYEHCKGCLVCVAECPPQTISQVREEAV
jgi:pyruvate ferredoxin oxidoreductase gamma subunit